MSEIKETEKPSTGENVEQSELSYNAGDKLPLEKYLTPAEAEQTQTL